MSLRDTIEAAVNTVETQALATETPAAAPVETSVPATEVKADVKADVPVVETAAEKAGRTAGRARDEHGRLLPGKAEKAAEAEPVKTEPQAQRPQRPSSWKKEMWEHWEKLDPAVAKYIHEREGQFAGGISTYKTDYDRLKPVADVIAQHEPFLRQQNIKPEQLVSNLMAADQTLRFGQPKDKLSLFAKLATDYQIPLHEMLVQGEDGKVYFNQEYFKPQQQQAQQAGTLTRDEALKLFQEQSAHQQWITTIRNFQEAKDDKGNPKYPHFETVRLTMDRLLKSGEATDLPTAYTKAVRLNDDIWEAEQAAKTAAAQSAAQKAQQAQVGKAKATAVSPRTATPSADADTGKAKGIRASLESAFDAHATPGRV